MIQPTALNLVIVGCMVLIFTFLWHTASGYLVSRNPDSAVGKGMGAAYS